MKHKSLTLTIVIPVFNEEGYLGACLDSIAAQSDRPDEVIVVDNNSTDATKQVATQYKFVRLISEKKQGRAYAQAKGFDLARGQVIGRIDADTILEKDWVRQTKEFFRNNPGLAAAAGNAAFYDFPFPKLTSAIHDLLYRRSQRLIAHTEVLWGANMAISSGAWRQLRAFPIYGNEIDEDIALSLNIRRLQMLIKRTSSMRASVSMRRGDLRFLSSVRYLSTWPRTYWRCGHHLQSVFIYLVKTFVLFIGMPIFIRNGLLIWSRSLRRGIGRISRQSRLPRRRPAQSRYQLFSPATDQHE